MDLKQLRTFIAIVDQKSFAAAADTIGLTQSAVSLHIKALETAMQTTLFNRAVKPPTLTEQGHELIDKAQHIISLCDDLTISSDNEGLSGSLKVGAVPTSLTGVLPRALASLKISQPHLKIQITSGFSNELAIAVEKGHLDCAVVSEPQNLDPNLNWRPFAFEPLMAIAPNTSRGKNMRELFQSHPFIRFKRHAWAGRLIDDHLNQLNIKINVGMEIDSLEAISLMVASGLGVSVVPKRHIKHPFPENIIARPFGEPPLFRVIGMIERTERPKKQLVKALNIELLKLCETSTPAET